MAILRNSHYFTFKTIKMSNNTSSYINVCSGSLLGIIKAISLFKIVDLLAQSFEVLVYGIIGAIGGAIGTAIIRWVISKFKKHD